MNILPLVNILQLSSDNNIKLLWISIVTMSCPQQLVSLCTSGFSVDGEESKYVMENKYQTLKGLLYSFPASLPPIRGTASQKFTSHLNLW